MTTYILHGGETSRKTDDNKKFFQEMVGCQDSVRILCVYFSQPEDTWSNFLTMDQERFAWACPDKTIHFSIASTDAEMFKQQIKENEVMYLKAGKTIKLLETLKTIEGFPELIQGKIVSGSSAGACVLSTYYFTGKTDSVITEGLGILPIKVFVHYDTTKEAQAKELEEYGDTHLPVYRLPEEKSLVIIQ